MAAFRGEMGLWSRDRDLNPGPADYERQLSSTKKLLNEFWSQYQQQFKKWLSAREISDRTKKDYLKALNKIFKERKVWLDRKSLEATINAYDRSQAYVFGLRHFLTFLGEEGIIREEIADYLKSKLHRKRSGIRQVFISDEELREAYSHIKEKGEPYLAIFLFMVYSGMRLSQTVRILNTWRWQKAVIVNDKIIRYPAEEATRGKKRAFWAYLPRDFAELLEPMSINHNTAQDTKYGRVSPNTIRKWHYTFLIRQGVPADVADFIQGRASERVGVTHYLNKTLLADEWYSAVVDELKKVLEGY